MDVHFIKREREREREYKNPKEMRKKKDWKKNERKNG